MLDKAIYDKAYNNKLHARFFRSDLHHTSADVVHRVRKINVMLDQQIHEEHEFMIRKANSDGLLVSTYGLLFYSFINKAIEDGEKGKRIKLFILFFRCI